MPKPFHLTRQSPSLQKPASLGLIALLGTAVALSWLTAAAGKAPLPAVSSPCAPHPSSQRCAECHAEIVEGFRQAPHSRTLRRGTDPDALAHFSGQSFHREEPAIDYHYALRQEELQVSTPAFARDLPLSWIFGSGTHAQTPVIAWVDGEGKTAAIEHSVSWYPEHGLGTTLGTENLHVTEGQRVLGQSLASADAVLCFSCHSSYVPVSGDAIQFDQLQPNISCSRCHWNAGSHLDEMARGTTTSIERLSRLTPREAVDRCGECHRRAEEMDPARITRDNGSLARFAPIGLVQSPCFTRQAEVSGESGRPARLDCATCHDPHQPASRDWTYYARICLNCHDAAHNKAVDCPVAGRQENCLPCHMPPVRMHPQLEFTDHWIRSRKSAP